jgi:hypothetical protein
MATHNLDLTRRSGFRVVELDHGRVINDTRATGGTGPTGGEAERLADAVGWGMVQ